MSSWSLVRLEEVAAPAKYALATGPFGSAIGARFFRDHGVPVIRGGNLRIDVGVRLDDRDLVFISEEKAREFERSQVKRGDLIFTCWGTIGQVGLVDERARFDRYVVSNKQMKLTPDPAHADPLFLYYLLSSPQMVSVVQSIAIGSSVPGFNLTQLRNLRIPLPPRAEQGAIARTLGALDDKIAANEKTISTTENLLRAVFDQMLMVEDEDEPGFHTLDDVAEDIRVHVDPSDCAPLTPYIGLDHMPRGSVVLDEWGYVEEVSSVKLKFQRDQILFGKLRPYFRKVGLAPLNGVCSSDILVLQPKTPEWHAFLLMLVSSQEFIDYCDRASRGTRMPRVTWRDIAAYPVRTPSLEDLHEYQRFASLLLSRSQAAVMESRVLAKLRDTLLPRLISGEVRVRDGERVMEEAG